ncbi:MAG: hypothetical protein ACLFWL_10235 [Candidatus Brocadiia bacterium]
MFRTRICGVADNPIGTGSCMNPAGGAGCGVRRPRVAVDYPEGGYAKANDISKWQARPPNESPTGGAAFNLSVPSFRDAFYFSPQNLELRRLTAPSDGAIP